MPRAQCLSSAKPRRIDPDVTNDKVRASLPAGNNEAREGGATFAGLVVCASAVNLGCVKNLSHQSHGGGRDRHNGEERCVECGGRAGADSLVAIANGLGWGVHWIALWRRV